MNNIKIIIGDYQQFFSNLLINLKESGINITDAPISHFLYRTSSLPEYHTLLSDLKIHCHEFVETQFNDRAIAMLVLKEPLQLENGFTVPMIELPAPHPDKKYPSGLESVGIVIGNQLPTFIDQHRFVLTEVKNNNQLASITYDNGQTAKFYHTSLKQIALAQGYVFTSLSDVNA